MSSASRFTLYRILPALFFVLLTGGSTTADETRQVPADHPERAKKGMALFKSDVRQLLVKHCLDCHGGKSVKGDFNLATRDKLVESGFLADSAEESHLFAVIAHTTEPHMPFKAEKLADKDIELIRKWIDLGAPYDTPLGDATEKPKLELTVSDDDRKFWSFRRLGPVEVPGVSDTDWCRTPIDHFIRQKQEAAGLNPNSLADRRILIRRAWFDLIGLPPTPEAVDAFVNDPDPNAWPGLIDELLASPQYGERWARHWIDVSRFAESHGYEQDYDRPTAYHYRDFLIRALNQDLPYDEFVRWQLAGDELAPNNPLAMMATGFLGGGAFPTQLTEAEFESARYDELDDMVMTTGVAFLGLSVGCARCHDHKFDPVPTKDYYALAATFATAIRCEAELDLNPEENQKRRTAYEAELSARQAALEKYTTTELPDKFATWLAANPEASASEPWEVLHVVGVESSAGTKFVLQPDGSLLATGNAPPKDVLTIVAQTHRKSLRSLRLEALAHDSLPNRGPGRAANGNFALGRIGVELVSQTAGRNSSPLMLTAARATHQQNTDSLSVAASIDDDDVSGWAVDSGGIGKDQAAVFDFAQPLPDAENMLIRITLTFQHPNSQHSIGRFRLSVTDREQLPAEVGASGPDAAVVKALAELKGTPDRSSVAWATGLAWFATTDAQSQMLQASIRDYEKQGPGLQLAKALITSEGLPHLSHHADDRGFPHFYPEVHVLKRGDVHQKQQLASAGFLQVLSPAGKSLSDWQVKPPEGWTRTSFRRASLANWMTDTNEGAGSLAARVMVNRLWQHHFGRGLVATPNDFGISGERPSHPELLDWLAQDLVQNGWKLKRIHRMIMNSSVYMQAGTFDEARAAVDRENTLLWRRTPKRLEAEAIRDSMLSVSGRLDLTQFGPGTLDQNMTRRSVYFFIKRSQLIPVMMLFDWPEHLVSIGQRPVTTIAPQALMFMNSPQGRDYATAFAGRLPSHADQMINEAWRLAFGRVPSAEESEAARAFLEQQTAMHSNAGANAVQQARIDLCQTILSMNEFVYIE